MDIFIHTNMYFKDTFLYFKILECLISVSFAKLQQKGHLRKPWLNLILWLIDTLVDLFKTGKQKLTTFRSISLSLLCVLLRFEINTL